MATTPFLKMHGLGNDFVVLDARTAALDLTPERRRVIADRRLGVGCDQLIVLEPPTEREADVFMRIYNPDGGEAQACGNATRCVASVVMDERKTDQVTVQTVAGLLESQKTGIGSNGLPVISVDLGPARLDWREIPVREACDTKHMPVGMALKSESLASNFSDPEGRYTLQQFCAVRGRTYHPKGVPLTLEDFLDYAAWFQQQAVPDIKDAKLTRLRQTQNGFELKFDNGETAWAKRVIMAVGHLPFRHIPAIVSQVSSDLVSHSSDHSDLSKFAGKDVTIIGCGQSGL